jgi:hypothetical protein
MKIFVYISSIAVLIAGGCLAKKSSFSSSYDFNNVEKVAIVAIEGAVKSETAKDQIADFFAMELLDNGYAPIALAQVRRKLEEQELNADDLTTIEAATEAGLILKVPIVLIVNIPRFDEEITMTAKMINSEDGSIVWMGKEAGKTGRSSSGVLLGVIAGGNTRSEENDLMTGPIAELFGGETDPALTPDEEQRIQRIVRSICTSLPVRSNYNW